MLDKLKIFLKDYFIKPGVNPVAFFYTPMVIPSILIICILTIPNFFEAINMPTANLFTLFISLIILIFSVGYRLLCLYTYAFLTDYVLYVVEPIERFSFRRFIFLRSVVFNRNLGVAARAAYDKEPEEWIIEDNRIRKNNYERLRNVGCATFVVLPIIKFIIALLMLPIFYISPLLHPLIIKKYRQLMSQREGYYEEDVNI